MYAQKLKKLFRNVSLTSRVALALSSYGFYFFVEAYSSIQTEEVLTMINSLPIILIIGDLGHAYSGVLGANHRSLQIQDWLRFTLTFILTVITCICIKSFYTLDVLVTFDLFFSALSVIVLNMALSRRKHISIRTFSIDAALRSLIIFTPFFAFKFSNLEVVHLTRIAIHTLIIINIYQSLNIKRPLEYSKNEYTSLYYQMYLVSLIAFFLENILRFDNNLIQSIEGTRIIQTVSITVAINALLINSFFRQIILNTKYSYILILLVVNVLAGIISVFWIDDLFISIFIAFLVPLYKFLGARFSILSGGPKWNVVVISVSCLWSSYFKYDIITSQLFNFGFYALLAVIISLFLKRDPKFLKVEAE